MWTDWLYSAVCLPLLFPLTLSAHFSAPTPWGNLEGGATAVWSLGQLREEANPSQCAHTVCQDWGSEPGSPGERMVCICGNHSAAPGP